MKARFGRYVFLKKLAQGGMAEIFLVRRLSFGGFAKFVVIKRLLPHHRGKKAYERLFLNEARIGALLDHPNIVSLHDLGMLDDTYFMAMEYVHGLSGAEMMTRSSAAQKPIPLGVALRVGIDLADALYYCAETRDLDGSRFGVLHHDISPHNIQISYEGDVKLLDFGVATRMGYKAPGGRRGKFSYMSPEALAKGDLDPRSDLFSMGVVLYEMTTGRRLFKGTSSAETEVKAKAGVVPRPTEIDTYFPPSLEEVLLRMLARDPADRYPTGQALATALKQVARKLGVDTSAEALSRYLDDLCGAERQERRDELRRLAAQADALPKKKAPKTPVPDDVDVPDQSLELPPPDGPAVDEEETPIPEGLESELSNGESLPGLEAPLTTVPPLEALKPQDSLGPSTLPPEAHDKDEDWEDRVKVTRSPLPKKPSDPPPPPPAAHPATQAPTAPSSAPLWLALALVVLAAGIGWFVTQRPTEGTLTLISEPPNARVYDGEKLLGMTPFKTTPQPVGKTFSLRFVRDGYSVWEGPATIDANHPDGTLRVVLVKE